jgi:hypothetical protein
MVFDANTALLGIDFVKDEPYIYGYYEYLISEEDPGKAGTGEEDAPAPADAP